MTISEFFNKWSGKGIDFDYFYGFQCMDLVHQYAVEVVGVDIPAAPAAKDVWLKETPGYTKIPNTPTGVPLKGDIVIWGVGVGAYGHIAVFEKGDINTFTSFDQNWPVNSLCHFQQHNYTGVLGWLRPKTVPNPAPTPTPIPTPPPVINDQTKYDFGGDLGVQEMGGVRSIINDQRAKIKNLLNDVEASHNELTVQDSRVYDLEKQLLNCQNSSSQSANLLEKIKALFR